MKKNEILNSKSKEYLKENFVVANNESEIAKKAFNAGFNVGFDCVDESIENRINYLETRFNKLYELMKEAYVFSKCTEFNNNYFDFLEWDETVLAKTHPYKK
jgi:hypothetical protein